MTFQNKTLFKYRLEMLLLMFLKFSYFKNLYLPIHGQVIVQNGVKGGYR